MKKLLSILLLAMLAVPAFCANPSFQSFSQTWFTTNSLSVGFQPNIPITKLILGDASLDFAQAPFQIRATDSLGTGFKLWGVGATPTFTLFTNIFQFTNNTAASGLTGDSSGNMTGSGTATFAHFVGDGSGLTGIPGGTGGTNMVPVSLTISGTNVAVVGTLPTGANGVIKYDLIATTNVFIQKPSGTPVDGQVMTITLNMDAVGTWFITFDTNSAGGFKAGVDLMLPLPNSTNALATDVIGFYYKLSKNKWLVTSHVRGY